MSTDVLQKVHHLVQQSPHSAPALMLFALCKTLDTEKGNHMYTLGKLKDLSAEHRQLAYQLIELMATGCTHDEHWNSTLGSMEALIRGDVD
jgi:hypothetical protein